jgi:hypothetical protein
LRAYAPVTTAREVAKETQIRGCTFKPGHMVLLSFPAANRIRRRFLKRIGSSSLVITEFFQRGDAFVHGLIVKGIEHICIL